MLDYILDVIASDVTDAPRHSVLLRAGRETCFISDTTVDRHAAQSFSYFYDVLLMRASNDICRRAKPRVTRYMAQERLRLTDT